MVVGEAPVSVEPIVCLQHPSIDNLRQALLGHRDALLADFDKYASGRYPISGEKGVDEAPTLAEAWQRMTAPDGSLISITTAFPELENGSDVMPHLLRARNLLAKRRTFMSDEPSVTVLTYFNNIAEFLDKLTRHYQAMDAYREGDDPNHDNMNDLVLGTGSIGADVDGALQSKIAIFDLKVPRGSFTTGKVVDLLEYRAGGMRLVLSLDGDNWCVRVEGQNPIISAVHEFRTMAFNII